MASTGTSVPEIKSSMVTTVAAGTRAVLNCTSNDYAHNFFLWLYNLNAIGPSAKIDEQKYNYQVLSGKLHINKVSPDDAGHYTCLSKKLDGTGIAASDIEMIVTGSTFSAGEVIKLLAIVISLLVIISCAVIYYRLKREWNRYDGRAIVPVDDVEDEDGDGDEIYNQTTTSISQPVPGPSRNQSSEQLIYGIDNQGLDTDFNSVFENIQIKSPQRSLI